MNSTAWDTQEIGSAPALTAPDGSDVRVLCATERGSMISFALPPGAVSRPVAHRTVEEIWLSSLAPASYGAGSAAMRRSLASRPECR
jgi:hypothetical protein